MTRAGKLLGIVESETPKITKLSKSPTSKHGVAIINTKKKGEFYLNYFDGVVTIRSSEAKLVKKYRGSEEEILAALDADGYREI